MTLVLYSTAMLTGKSIFLNPKNLMDPVILISLSTISILLIPTTVMKLYRILAFLKLFKPTKRNKTSPSSYFKYFITIGAAGINLRNRFKIQVISKSEKLNNFTF